MAYIVSVIRNLNGGRDEATVSPVAEQDGLAVTNRLRHVPPVQDDRSYYVGIFAESWAARAAIQEAFGNSTPIRWLD